LGRDGKVGKGYVGSREMVIWLGLLHPKYLIIRELRRMDKLKVGWGIRRYEEKVKMSMASKTAKECWQEKEQYDWKDRYGERREGYYIGNGWGTDVWEVREGQRKKWKWN